MGSRGLWWLGGEPPEKLRTLHLLSTVATAKELGEDVACTTSCKDASGDSCCTHDASIASATGLHG